MYNEQISHPGNMDARPDAVSVQNPQYDAPPNIGDAVMPVMESPQRLQIVEQHVAEGCAAYDARNPDAQSAQNYGIMPEVHGTPNSQYETAHSFSEFAIPDREDHASSL